MNKFFLLLFGVIFLFASKEVEIFGSNSHLDNGVLVVDDAIALDGNMTISAQKIYYYKNKKIIIAKGNVYINYDKNDFLIGQTATIHLDSKKLSIVPFFLFNFQDNDWMSAKSAKQLDDNYISNNTISSTCDPNHPDWEIVASSSTYNKTTKWVNLYNPTLYFKGMPIFYFPYLGFSLSKKRTSGFLRPLLGYSVSEGFFVTQPYYLVLGEHADLELDPTIRTFRGKGLYATFRFVHSASSRGKIKIGEFADKTSYQQKYNLANRVHKGWEFLYKNSGVLFSNDKIYFDIKNANDVDYFYLDAYNYTFDSSVLSNKILTSNINYYTTDGSNYFGVYAKYFKDTSKTDNSDTMQLLPQLNYHRFSDNFYDNFIGSIDMNVYNYTRKEGYRAIKKSLLLPISYDKSFFDDYLKTTITEQFSLEQLDTSDGNTSTSYNANTFLKIYTNLSKNYKTFSHQIAPSVVFNFSNTHYFSGEQNEYISDTSLQKNISFKLSEYLIAKNWSINHIISQVYYTDTKTFSDLLNDVTFRYNSYYLENNFKYSKEKNRVNYDSTTVGYDNGDLKIEVSNTYQRAVDGIQNSNTLNFDGYWMVDGMHKIFAQYNYDLELDKEKYYIIGVSMKKKCWNYSISYKKETVPSLTNDGVSNLVQKTIYFEIELVPLGGIKQQYQLKTEKVGE